MKLTLLLLTTTILFTACSKPPKKPTICTMEYMPVCGKIDIEKTYSNRCMMRADGANFLYSGKCR